MNEADENDKFFITDVYKPDRKCISCANWSSAVWFKHYFNELNNADETFKTDAEGPNPSSPYFVCRIADVIPLRVVDTGLSEYEEYTLTIESKS